MIAIPTIQDLEASIEANLELEFQATINPDGPSILGAFDTVQAGKLHQYYLAIYLLQRNMFPDTCDYETLLRVGKIRLGRYPFGAVAGNYSVTVTGTVGGTIKQNTTFKSDDDSLNPGILYMLDSAFTISASTEQITVRALTPGLEGKLNIGDTLTSTEPIPLVNSGAVVTSEVVQPLAAETEDAYRSAVLASYRLEPQGGAAGDYRIWSADAQGVAKVYPYATPNAVSQVDLYIEALLASSSDGKGTPTQSIIDAVEAVVNFNPDITLPTNERGRRPIQVIVNYKPVSIISVNILITGSVGFSVSEKAQILTSLTAAFALVRPFVAAADLATDENDIISNNNVTGIIVTVKPGAQFTGLGITFNGIAYQSYKFVNGNIPYLNSVTYN